jgi:hypothetical protein
MMRSFATVCLLVGAWAHTTGQQGVTCVEELETTNHCYKLYEPRQRPRGLVVLLPAFGDTVEFFDQFQLPTIMRDRGYLVAAFSMAGYITWEKDLAALHKLVSNIVEAHDIPPATLAIAGFSAGGTGAIRYTEYCIERGCPPPLRPAAAVSVDGPLDFERWYHCSARRAARQPANHAGAIIANMLSKNLGGSPVQRRAEYVRAAPLTVTEPNGGNARLLRDTPVRTYSEPDIIWSIENWSSDYYCLNAIDQAALVQELRFLGNRSADLITTTGKGYRVELNPDTGRYQKGERSPHSWSIVDERELADWIERHTSPTGSRPR